MLVRMASASGLREKRCREGNLSLRAPVPMASVQPLSNAHDMQGRHACGGLTAGCLPRVFADPEPQ
jgi:hypothetical protein